MKKDESKWKLYVIPGSHFDLGWTSTPGESLVRGDEIIKEALDAILGEHPDYRFTIEYAFFFKHFIESFPSYFEKVKRLLYEKKISLAASWTGLMDQVLDGESVVRNVVMAKRWAKEVFDIDLEVSQLTDCPGHGAQIAQILSKCGVKYLAYSRYSPPVPLHYWEGLDGSRVIAANHSLGLYKGAAGQWPGSGYNTGSILREGMEKTKEELPGQLEKVGKVWPRYRFASDLTPKYFPVLMGDQSDLYKGDTGICETVKRWNEENEQTSFKIGTIEEYFKEIESLISSSKNGLCTFKGEAPYEFYSLPSCFPKIYKTCRQAENRLLAAEKLSSLTKLLNLKETYPHVEIEQGWENLTFPQDHNVGGMHGAINDRVRLNKARGALDIGSSLIEEATHSVAGHIAYKKEGVPVVVFNPLCWEREEVVKAEAILFREESKAEGIRVKDSNGETVPSQLIGKEINTAGTSVKARLEFLFLARVPALGYKTFYIYPQGKKGNKALLSILDDVSFENDFFKITFSSHGIGSIRYKGRELVLKDKHCFGQVVVLEDKNSDVGENLTGKEWEASYDLSTLTIVENGCLRARVKWEGRVLDSKIIQEVVFYSNTVRLDISNTIDWEGRKNSQVRVAYPVDIPGAKISYEIPYGSIVYPDQEIPNTYRGTGGRYIQKWIDISNDNHGIIMATQNCTHSLSAPSTIYPVLIRTAYSCGDSFYWYYNREVETFSHSFKPHRGEWKEEHSHRHGWEYNNPLIVDERGSCLFPKAVEKGILAEEHSLASVQEENVVITTVKEAYERDGWVIRLFELEGREGTATINLSFPIKEAWETNLLEEKIKELECREGKARLEISSNGIHTIFVKNKEEKHQNK